MRIFTPVREPPKRRFYPARKVNHASALYVELGCESRNANAQEHQVALADIGNPLSAVWRNEDDVSWSNVGGRQFTDFHTPSAFQDDVSFADSAEQVPAGRHAWCDTGTSNGALFIRRRGTQLRDEAAFRDEEFSLRPI